jgi:hypothetical protein
MYLKNASGDQNCYKEYFSRASCCFYIVAYSPNAGGDNIQKLQGTRVCNSSGALRVLPPLPSFHVLLGYAVITCWRNCKEG